MTLLEVDETRVVALEEMSQVASARRLARGLGERGGLGTAVLGRLDLVVSEAATNVVRHAGHGHLALTFSRQGESRWIEMVAFDQGPGIRQLGRALAGGASTRGGLGQGLGAIRRLADRFAVFAPPGRGTAVLARIGTSSEDPPCAISGVSRALPGQAVCGDAWGARRMPGDRLLILVLDGVGHGPEAHAAARRGLAALGSLRRPSAGQLLCDVHECLRGTRGAAGLAVLVDPREGSFSSAGVGNLQASLTDGDQRQGGVISRSGALGSGSPVIEERSGAWSRDSQLIIQTDGVSASWRVEHHRGLWRQNPGIVAAVLFRDHAWPHDDASVVVIQCRHGQTDNSGG